MNIQDVFYHGIRAQVRRVLNAMTDEQIDAGLDAFDTGASNWSHCFFARALRGVTDLDAVDKPELEIMRVLKLPTVVPVRIIYHTFDGAGKAITRDQLKEFIACVRADRVNTDVEELLKSLDWTGVEEREVSSCPS